MGREAIAIAKCYQNHIEHLKMVSYAPKKAGRNITIYKVLFTSTHIIYRGIIHPH